MTDDAQAQQPGHIEPQRTPGTAPSVVPLPDGADPKAKPGEHPLPEEAIDGYPRVAELYADDTGPRPAKPDDTPAATPPTTGDDKAGTGKTATTKAAGK